MESNLAAAKEYIRNPSVGHCLGFRYIHDIELWVATAIDLALNRKDQDRLIIQPG